MSMSTPTEHPWYALYVKARHEKQVALMLDGRGYDILLPTYPRYHTNGKTFDLPLFPGYVFCQFDLQNRIDVLSTPGVFCVVGTGERPQALGEHEIVALHRMMEPGLERRPWLEPIVGKEIVVDSGPLKGVRGTVIDASNQKWLIISVQLLQRSVAVRFDRRLAPATHFAPASVYVAGCGS